MIRRVPILVLSILVLAACDGFSVPYLSAETQARNDRSWKLIELRGEGVGSAGIVFDISGGFINGTGPCNTINANYVGEAPDFQVQTLITTKRACAGLALEQRLIEALKAARSMTRRDGRLVLSAEGVELLVFEPS